VGDNVGGVFAAEPPVGDVVGNVDVATGAGTPGNAVDVVAVRL